MVKSLNGWLSQSCIPPAKILILMSLIPIHREHNTDFQILVKPLFVPMIRTVIYDIIISVRNILIGGKKC